MKRSFLSIIVWVLVFVIFSIRPVSADIIYVDDSATGANNGSSWTDAYNFLQDALTQASSEPNITEIHVTQGIYKPDSNSVCPDGTGDREASFYMINGIEIKGGYAGYGETDPNVRDFILYETILSGDIGTPADINDNCYHVFYHTYHSYLDSTAILDGVTIKGGNANEPPSPHCHGGGIYSEWSEQTITNCVFNENSASLNGGGLCNYNPTYALNDDLTNSDSEVREINFDGPKLTNCTFMGNSARNYGGGIYNLTSDMSVTNCNFIGNSANNGGGMYNDFYSNPIVRNCIFNSNLADFGGGMYNDYHNSPVVTNCTFSNNIAYSGGVIYNYFSNGPTLLGCIFSKNSATDGPGLACDSYNQNYPSTVTLTNCIIWNGESWLWNNDNSTINVEYSDIEGGWPGEGNIDMEPLFADADSNDFHIKSQAGRWDENSQSWITDANTSPCIDAGNWATPVGFEPFPNGGRINMGAYGGTSQASKSYFGTEPCVTIIAGDINGDCKVDFIDFAIMALHWQEEQ